MATLVFFHAHPDDESVTTGGSIAKYAAAGHRTVLVIATGGELGEVPDDLADGETLTDRRRAETEQSARLLGLAAIYWLGYGDSGMDGWEQNAHPGSFHQAPLEEAAERLAAILRAEQADVLTVYDFHGNYGHPDHVKVHHVGHRAAELAGVKDVFEATLNRDAIVRWIEDAREAGIEVDVDREDPEAVFELGMPESALTTMVDVSEFVDRKRASVASHSSQVTDSEFFLKMDPERFAQAFGTEWYIHKGVPAGISESDLV
jgi:LmbE family N-acetylglucosaminyl deacetylase